MTRYFALALHADKSYTSSKPIPARSSKAGLRLKNSSFWLMSLLFILGVAYLLQVGSLSTKGYVIKDLEVRLADLKEQNGRLEIEARSLQAIENIETEARTLNLVPAGVASHPLLDGNFSYQR